MSAFAHPSFRSGLGDVSARRLHDAPIRLASLVTCEGCCLMQTVHWPSSACYVVSPTSKAVDESIDLSHEIFTRVFRRAAREEAE